MDFIVFSSIKGTDLVNITISYDISCQFSKKIWKRHSRLPPGLQIDPNIIRVSFAIPKFHLPAHHATCHTLYSFNYRFGAGLTEGEYIERDWSLTKAIAMATAEMASGHRADTVDDTCGFINFMKLVAMSKLTAYV